MKSYRPAWNICISSLAILILILDAQTALKGVRDGIAICLQTVIPSLFPFFIFSSLLAGSIHGLPLKGFRWLQKLLKIPAGAEILWITGLLGGYPTGAKCIAQACERGALEPSIGQRMMGYCNNAGPAFLFGMASFLFPGKLYPWLLFGVQILSSLLTGILLRTNTEQTFCSTGTEGLSWNQALHGSLRATASVCGWILLFRVILTFSERWFLWFFPVEISVFFTGVLELSNGILILNSIDSVPERFILCAALLNFGGLCVAMQTAAVVTPLKLSGYFTAKLLQTSVSILLSSMVCAVLQNNVPTKIWISSFFVFLFCLLLQNIAKKRVEIQEKLLYNSGKHC